MSPDGKTGPDSPTKGGSSDQTRLLLAVTSIGHGQRGTARTLLDEFARKRDHRAALLDLDLFVSGSKMFQAATIGHIESEQTVERIRNAIRENNQGPWALAALDPVAALVCRQALPDVALALVQCGIVSDSRWPAKHADLVLVPDERASREFLDLGAGADCIVPVGIPLCPGFTDGAQTHREDALAAFGLSADRPVVLVVTEGLSAFQAVTAATTLASPPGVLQVTVDLAGDTEAAEAFTGPEQADLDHVRWFGKTDMASRLWTAADLIVCHPSDHVVARALALGKPVVLLPADRPSAVQVVAAVLDRDLGLAVADWDDLGRTVTKALSLLPRLQRAVGPYRSASVAARMVTTLQAFSNRNARSR